MIESGSLAAISTQRFEALRQDVLSHDEIGAGDKLRALAATFHQDAIGINPHDRAGLRSYCEDFLKLLPLAAAKGDAIEQRTRDILAYDGLFTAAELKQIIFAAVDGAANVTEKARASRGEMLARQDIVSETARDIGLYLHLAQDAFMQINNRDAAARAEYTDGDLAGLSKKLITIRGALNGEIGAHVAVSEALADHLVRAIDYRAGQSSIADLISKARTLPDEHRGSDDLALAMAAQFKKLAELQVRWPGSPFPVNLPKNFSLIINQSNPSPGAIAALAEKMIDVAANILPRAFTAAGENTFIAGDSAAIVQKLVANALTVFENMDVPRDEALPLTEQQLTALSIPINRFYDTAAVKGVTMRPRENDSHAVTFAGIEPGPLTGAMFDLNMIRNKVMMSLHDVRDERRGALA